MSFRQFLLFLANLNEWPAEWPAEFYFCISNWSTSAARCRGMGVARASYWSFKQHAEVAVRRCRRRGARARWPSPPAIGSPAGASTARLGVTQDDLRHLQIVAVTSLPETFRNAVTVLRVAILAHLPLALESRNRKTEPDDASQHHIDVARGSVREHPWLSFVPLLLSGQLAHMAVQPVLVPDFWEV